MQLKSLLPATIIIASSSRATAAEITMFVGADCSGPSGGTATGLTTGECLTLGENSTKSVSYKDVPAQIQFFISGGRFNTCTNVPSIVRVDGSGCATAPDGSNWESFAVF